MERTVPRYRRVVVKLSGEALAGSGSSGVDPASLSRVAEEEIPLSVICVYMGGNKKVINYIAHTGDVKQWPGPQQVNPKSVGECVAALATWQAMRAAAKANKGDGGKRGKKGRPG